ncbi:hypothetical protein FUAX_25840 [Fulvitalea axinellae]|uniref:YjgP/YjgQ family permease n=1 Tax=Fulvitalea axinellae TaxID=1182444 RepID=A0AAU9CQB4_9BACT|nr:hypothetical protein FUAX_25840 [Fulvitalea axinellae]
MKKIDKLVLWAFIKPFFLTFFIVLFILLMQFLLRYFDDLVGKDLGFAVISELVVYMAVFLSPQAFPLSILLASLMTYGNLGEHFELTAVKAAGVSLIRTLRPIFVFAILLSTFAFYVNGFVVPAVNLRFFRLLYDVKQKKAAMQIPPGVFYNDLKNYSIKIGSRTEEGILHDVLIYDHSSTPSSNKSLTLADSGKMYTVASGSSLVFELYSGNVYDEKPLKNSGRKRSYGKKKLPLTHAEFDTLKMIVDLSSLALGNTDEKAFQGHRMTLALPALSAQIDSLREDAGDKVYMNFRKVKTYFNYHLKGGVEIPERFLKAHEAVLERRRRRSRKSAKDLGEEFAKDQMAVDSLEKLARRGSLADSAKIKSLEKTLRTDAKIEDTAIASTLPKDTVVEEAQKYIVPLDTSLAYLAKVDASIIKRKREKQAYDYAKGQVSNIKSTLSGEEVLFKSRRRTLAKAEIERMKRYAGAFACLIMFLVGAPLGSIIKKGGLGVPVLVSIIFFIFYYVISSSGERMARAGTISPWLGVWMANMALLPVGLFFLRQAKNDARLFDSDFYIVVFNRVKDRFFKKKKKAKA